MIDQNKKDACIAVQSFLANVDVDMVGIASLQDLKGSKLEEAALRLLPETHSVIVFGLEIYTEILDHVRPGRTMGLASLNDLLNRNADYLSGRLTKNAYDVTKISHQNGLRALPLPAVGCPLDTRFLEAVFSYKHAGQAAGIGVIGKSSLLISKDIGPRVRLSCCLTEAVLESTSANIANICEGCDICIDNCPASALKQPQSGEQYIINKFACAHYQNASGGCSDCMRVCPAGR